MNSVKRERLPAQAASRLKGIRSRTWMILGAAVLAFIGLLIWTVIAALSWLFSQVATVSDVGKRFADEAVTQVEQIAPGLREQAGQWVPAGVKDQANRWLPMLGADLPPVDVSGTDVGPVTRFPGLVRSHFMHEGKINEVRYTGNVPFAAVLTHYVQGFADASYAHEVISATTSIEQHRFKGNGQSIDFSLLRHPGAQIEVRLRLSSS
tara:strand:+ start:10121 stop:10744 length:624 start_codon:yes stop_codon:yes gene_type:complete